MQIGAVDDGPFELPDGWVLEIRPRGKASSTFSDKYYYEPHTGRKFRSLASIKRYLNGQEEPTSRPKADKTHQEGALSYETIRRIVCDGKVWKSEETEASTESKDVISNTSQYRASSILPEGWIEEHIPRKRGLKSDRYFIEPGTGRKFRSLPEVERYLTGRDRIRPELKPLKSMYPKTDSAPRNKKRSVMTKTTESDNFDSFNLPEKVNWVLSSSVGEDWTPFADESEIPSHAKERWRDAFFLGMTRRKQPVH